MAVGPIPLFYTENEDPKEVEANMYKVATSELE